MPTRLPQASMKTRILLTILAALLILPHAAATTEYSMAATLRIYDLEGTNVSANVTVFYFQHGGSGSAPIDPVLGTAVGGMDIWNENQGTYGLLPGYPDGVFSNDPMHRTVNNGIPSYYQNITFDRSLYDGNYILFHTFFRPSGTNLTQDNHGESVVFNIEDSLVVNSLQQNFTLQPTATEEYTNYAIIMGISISLIIAGAIWGGGFAYFGALLSIFAIFLTFSDSIIAGSTLVAIRILFIMIAVVASISGTLTIRSSS